MSSARRLQAARPTGAEGMGTGSPRTCPGAGEAGSQVRRGLSSLPCLSFPSATRAGLCGAQDIIPQLGRRASGRVVGILPTSVVSPPFPCHSRGAGHCERKPRTIWGRSGRPSPPALAVEGAAGRGMPAGKFPAPVAMASHQDALASQPAPEPQGGPGRGGPHGAQGGGHSGSSTACPSGRERQRAGGLRAGSASR